MLLRSFSGRCWQKVHGLNTVFAATKKPCWSASASPMSCHCKQLGSCKCQASGVLLLLVKLYRSASPSLLSADMRLRGEVAALIGNHFSDALCEKLTGEHTPSWVRL